MKRIIILISLLFVTLAYCQAINFRAISSGFSPLKEEKLPKMQKDNSIIVFEIEQKKITYYHETIQMTFNIFKFYEDETDDDGNEIMRFDAIDQDGNKNKLFFVELKSQKFDKSVNNYYRNKLIIMSDLAYLVVNMNELKN